MTLNNLRTLINTDLDNEWMHLNFYLYHAGVVGGLHAEEYREFLLKAAEGEMQHVHQFMRRLVGLGVTYPASAGQEFPKFTDPQDILAQAHALESQVITNYVTRLAQLNDPELANTEPEITRYLTVFYEDQLKDSYEDREWIARLLAKTK